MAAERSMITLGGKGSSFSSSSVYKIASGASNVSIDSSAIERLSTKPLPLIKRSSFFGILAEELTKEEKRASLVVLLNKLLLSNSSGSVRSVLPVKILEILNSKDDETFEFGDVEVTEEESVVLEKSCASLVGICSVIDHKATALSQIVDSVAALSVEATKGDITSFSSLDSGDGFGNKDAISVANDLKVLLNGSKAVGKVGVEEVSKIPRIHGKFRDVVRSVHSDARVELNSAVKGVVGIGESLGATLSALCVPIKNLGECSFKRAKLCVVSIVNDNLREHLLEESCAEFENLKSGLKLALVEEDPCRLAHMLNESLSVVWRIVGLEAASAYFALAELKSLLGKGTSLIIQFIKDRLVSDQIVDQILNLFNPEGQDFDCLLAKVKEIVESNENRRLPKLPKGTRDFSQKKMIIRENTFSTIQSVFKKHGATALDTPVFELREMLMGKYGEDSKLIYDIADQGGELCSLRYDLTVPFARHCAMNGITSFKKYQIGKVYRRDNPSHGRYREFYQCDFDIAGLSERMGPDFEVVKILTELLDKLDIGDYVVKLNHRKLLDGMLEICGVPAEKFRTICSSIDKLDKQSREQVKKEMVEEKGLSSEVADRIRSFVDMKGAPMELLSKLREEGSEFLGNKSANEALDELGIMFEALERSKCIQKVIFDLSLARGLDYYTGVIFEAVLRREAAEDEEMSDNLQVGSIAAGGRYDNLIGIFGKKQVPAVGMSLGIERVFNIMENKQNLLEEEPKRVVLSTETQVLVSVMEDNKLGVAAELVSELWEAGITAEYLVTKRRGKHFDRARSAGCEIPWMVIVGKKELSEGVNVTLRKMDEGSEESVPRDRFVAKLLERL
ncbi:unnamed protein product [Eruca vesicaria subsp. sativa]|uniref:Histidine--tRNA ligase, cytoplasmic n=1 Tax=Eruca vesicaria subsp. sativa TaxID=29727 RepID=A0ABC8JMA2_ERUVS|nr:unnamed protein product [Eruca vesicaria subsp. sativa]